MCIRGVAREHIEHYLLHCPQFSALRQHLLGQVSEAGNDVAKMSSKNLCQLLLYGKPNGTASINRVIFEATIYFMESLKPFN